jgi:SAM-dependent methyltransferase
MGKLTPMIPGGIKKPLKNLGTYFTNLSYHGKGRLCPVCGKTSRHFRPFGVIKREEAQCVHCSALERHRLLWLFLKKKTNLFDGKTKKVLHVAPEQCLESRFLKKLGEDYVTADLNNPRAMIKMDIMDIQYDQETFDVIYCSHVLEHVPDDRKAIREFFRVLKPGGWAILLVPINAEKTFEDPSIVEPKERLKAFGNEDHVRKYGPDYIDRLREAGFEVQITKCSDLATPEEMIKMGLSAQGKIFYCTK